MSKAEAASKVSSNQTLENIHARRRMNFSIERLKYAVSGLATDLSINYVNLDSSSIQRIAESLQPNEHIYIENISQRGRLAVWGASEDVILLEVQYTACCFEAEISKTKIKEYFSDMVKLVDKPESFGLERLE